MPGKQFSVSIPSFARAALSRGKPRLFRRFEKDSVGDAWVKKVKAEIATLKAGGQARAIGIEPVRELSFTAAWGLFLDEADLKPRTREWYSDVIQGRLDKYFGELKLSQINHDAIREYFRFRAASKLSSSKDARHKDLTVLRRVLNWSHENGYAVDASAWKMKKPKVVCEVHRKFDPELAERFLAAATGRDKALIDVDLGTGMRRDELKVFHTSWIHWEARLIHVPAAVAKDSQDRSIPMFPSLERTLKEWLGERRTGPVFPPLRHGASGTGMARGPDLIGIFRRLRKASGIAFRGWHDFRHHYISLLFKLHRPIPEIMQITGIDDMKTLAKYAHASCNYLKEVRDAIEADRAVRGGVAETVAAESQDAKKPASETP